MAHDPQHRSVFESTNAPSMKVLKSTVQDNHAVYTQRVVVWMKSYRDHHAVFASAVGL